MSDLEKTIIEFSKNPKFKKELEEMEDEFNLTSAVIAARISCKMTQAELAKRSGLRQSNISRIERGDCNPNFSTLKAIAKGLGKKLVIKFE